MKKVLYVLILLGVVLTSIQVASHYFRNDLYTLAMAFEADKAGLVPQHRQIQTVDYYYLSRIQPSADKTLVLLHGFSADKENWLRFSQYIPNNINIYALDLLGHGQHPINLAQNYSIETQVDYLHQFITQQIKKPVHIIGNSMGGAISALYAAKYPDDINTLMLISPAGVHAIPSELDTALDKGNNPLIIHSADDFNRVIDFVMEAPPFIPSAILAVQAEKSIARAALNQKIFDDIRQDMHKNLDQHFSLIQAPTLILWGKEDRVINAENSHQYTTLIPNAKPITLEGIGHLAMIEAPKVSAQAFITHASNAVLSPPNIK